MKKILICGLGAVGLTYAVKFKANSELKILVDKERLERYIQNKPRFNDVIQDFEYILPDNKFFLPDLIIIATKSQGLESAIKNIKNFVHENVVIISLLNGISSEEKIQETYPNATVLKSYFTKIYKKSDLKSRFFNISISSHFQLLPKFHPTCLRLSHRLEQSLDDRHH